MKNGSKKRQVPHNRKHTGTSENAFVEWLKKVPPGSPKDEYEPVECTVKLTMHPSEWIQLAHGASRNGWTLERCIVELLVDGGPGICEWANWGFPSKEERRAK